MRASLLCFALAVGLLLVMPTVASYAQASPRDAVPAELAAGTLGGAVVGGGTAYLAAAICAADADGWEALACIAYGALGYVVGLPIGTTVGVHIAGAAWGVDGNTLLSVLGAIGGEAGGLLITSGLGALQDDPPEAFQVLAFLGLTPLASSAGATWGFNVGATLSRNSE